ncbi:hypothetical protein MMPV_008226 [Pyropia vietnamensis]
MRDVRVTLRRRNAYSTLSNRVRKVKTPGGKLVVQYIRKAGSVARCADTKTKLHGVCIGRPKDFMRMSKPKKSVTRVYGGNLCGKAVRERIIRAFLIEEQKIVKKVIKAQNQQKKASK